MGIVSTLNKRDALKEFFTILFSNYYEIEVMSLLLDIPHPNNIFSPK